MRPPRRRLHLNELANFLFPIRLRLGSLDRIGVMGVAQSDIGKERTAFLTEEAKT
jgi:hypothetical protein